MVPQAFSGAWGTTNFPSEPHRPMPPSDEGPKSAPSPREAKLAQALRANLKRRKANGAPKEPAPAKAKTVDDT
jgi:hypothetical protein